MSGAKKEVKKLFVETYGCQMNVRDSEEITGRRCVRRNLSLWNPVPITPCELPSLRPDGRIEVMKKLFVETYGWLSFWNIRIFRGVEA